MKIIDMHSHIFPASIAEKVIGALETFYGFRWAGTGELDDVLRSLRQAHITRCVIFSSATKASQVESINSFVASLQSQYPELLLGFGTMHPDYPDCRAELARMRKLGLHGLKFHPDFQQFCVDDPRMLKIYEAAGEFSFPMLFHIGDYRTPYSKPERLAHVHELYPDLTLIAAHMGGYSEWDKAWKYLIGKDIWMDISSVMPLLSVEEVRKMVLAHGVDRVLFASDYPATRHDQAVQNVLKLGLPPEDNEKIFYRNAEKLLGITC